ncbi:MAG: PASTA domain-containing protein [Thermoanaerobaculia bacterium]|nr:PASTA domain-containing protein [Thermoanaerobaculia bacterium]
MRGRVVALAGRARSPLAALALLLAALAALALAAWRADGVPPDAHEELSEPRFLFRFKVPTARQTAGNLAAARPAEHETPKLSEAEMAKRQADVSEYLGEVKRGGRALDRAAFLEVYKRAGTFHVIHALLETGVISKATSDELGKLRADLHNQVLDEMARSGKFGRRIGVNDFGSGAMNAKSDIDFTLYCDDPNVPGTALVAAYKEIFQRLSGGLAPGAFDLVAHRWEATIPDWRAGCAEADFVQKLRTGTQLLKANPEAYFLEGAYAQQILRRSAQGTTFTWIEKMPDGSYKRRSVNAALDTRFFYHPDVRARYAWGAAIGNWHFFNSHGHDRIAQAKYLLRSFDDGMALLARSGKKGDLIDLSRAEMRAAVQEVYGSGPRAERFLAILETAVEIRKTKLTGPEAYRPLVEYERRQAGVELDDATALRLAEDALVRHGNAMLVENNRMAATTRLKDWLAPDIPRGKYRTVDDTGLMREIVVDAAAIKRLQLSAFFEIRDGIEKMDRSQVEAIKNDNPRLKGDIEILQRLIEKQRQMAFAPDDLDADAAREHRRSFAEEVIAEYRAIPAVQDVGGVQAVLARAANAWQLGNTIEERLQQRAIDAVAFNLAGRNPKVLGALEKLRKQVTRTNEQLVHPDWMQRMDVANSLVEVAKAYLEEGEVNERVLHTIFWEGVSFLPGGGTYMTIRGGGEGIVTLISTKLIPGYGPLLITLQLTKGVVQVGMMAIFEPLQRERLLLAYQGYLAPAGGGWITLSSGQRHEVRSKVPSILDGIADAATGDLDARREAVYTHFHALVSDAMRRDPSFPYTEEEWPWEFAERESGWVATRIRQHVKHWWDATGPFAGSDEILAFRSRLAGEDEEVFRNELVERLFKDYYTGKTRALQKKFLENEREQAALGALFAEAETMDAGLDAVAGGMSADFRANGDAIQAWCLDGMPTVPPSMEILAAPRIIDLEVEGEREKVRAIPQVGFRAKVWASEKEFPGPWKVRWEVRRGGETVAFDPGQDHDLEAKVGETVGTDSSRVDVVATATDATGRQIVSASVPLEVEKVKLGEDRPEERDEEEARDGTEAGTEAAAGAEVAGLVEEMEKAAGAATAAANAAGAACREAAEAGRSAREKATGLTAEVDGVSGAVGALEGRAAAVSGLGTAAAASLAKANALANDLAVRRDRAAALKEKACAGADRVAAAATTEERERLLAEAGSASAELDRLASGSESLLASVRAEAQAARRGSEELEALLAELTRLDESLRAAGEAAAGLPAEVEAARAQVEKARASLDKVVAQQAHGAQLVADGKRAVAGAGAEAAAAVKKLTDLEAAIRDRKEDVAPCADTVTAADVAPAAGAVQDLVARTGELTARLDGLRRTLGAEGLRDKLRGAAAEAESLVELCEAFLESIVNRAADARACLARARSAVAAPALVVVPDLLGKTRAMAEAWLGDLGLSPVVTTGGAAPPSGEPGRVASQTHPAGSRVPAGSFVGVTVWGPRAAAAPAAPPALPVPPAPLVPPAPAGLTQADCDRDWPGTVLTRDAGTARCGCPPGTAWSKVSRTCLALPGGTVGGARTLGGCSHMPGTIRDSRTGECRCALGTWDATQGRCVDTAAAAREADVAAKRAAADCENLFSRLKIYRGSTDSLSRSMAAEAEREARAKGCDAGRIADAKGPAAPPPVGGGTGSGPPVAGGSGTGGGGGRPATCQVTEQPGAGGVTLVYEQTALGNHTNVYVFTAPQKEAAAVQAHWNSQPGFHLVGRFGSYSQGLSAAKTACAKRTEPMGEAEPEVGPCNCVDEKGRRYSEAFGQPCGTSGYMIRDYHCPSR